MTDHNWMNLGIRNTSSSFQNSDERNSGIIERMSESGNSDSRESHKRPLCEERNGAEMGRTRSYENIMESSYFEGKENSIGQCGKFGRIDSYENSMDSSIAAIALSSPSSSTFMDVGNSDISSPSLNGLQLARGRFDTDFQIISLLGTGNFGMVYSVKGQVDDICYAIKKSKRRFHGDHDRSSMMMEIHACSEVSSSSDNDEVFSIVRYYAAWIQDDYIYLQMELCETSVENLIAEGHAFVGKEISLILRHMLLALKFLHSHSFVHLDIKPANILMKHGHYKLGDFGLARRHLQGHVMSGVEEGDSRYLAPELLEWSIRDKDLTKSDLFSLGITGYELCVGGVNRLPQNGAEWHSLRNNEFHLVPSKDGLTQEMVDIIRNLMHSDPSQRPAAEIMLTTFLSLASEKEREIYFLQLQNEALKSRLVENENKSNGVGRLKRHHSIL